MAGVDDGDQTIRDGARRCDDGSVQTDWRDGAGAPSADVRAVDAKRTMIDERLRRRDRSEEKREDGQASHRAHQLTQKAFRARVIPSLARVWNLHS